MHSQVEHDGVLCFNTCYLWDVGKESAGSAGISLMTSATFYVDHFIKLDRQYIRFQLVAGVFLVVIGTLVMVGTFNGAFVAGGPNVDMIARGVGVVVDLVGMFPFNNCWSRWERIKTLQEIKRNPALLDAKRAHELVDKLYAKFLGVR
jgi:hypothetical protein